MRRMSFSLTTKQVREKTKTVTRRQGWKNLCLGNTLQPIEKGMGLKKGEKQQLIGKPIRVVDTRWEAISDITHEDVTREGFPDKTKEWFIAFYCQANRCKPDDLTHRIEFEYTD